MHHVMRVCFFIKYLVSSLKERNFLIVEEFPSFGDNNIQWMLGELEGWREVLSAVYSIINL